MWGLDPGSGVDAVSMHPTVSSLLLPAIGNGTIVVKPQIERFAGDSSLLFSDGSRVDDIDAVIFATGSVAAAVAGVLNLMYFGMAGLARGCCAKRVVAGENEAPHHKLTPLPGVRSVGADTAFRFPSCRTRCCRWARTTKWSSTS